MLTKAVCFSFSLSSPAPHQVDVLQNPQSTKAPLWLPVLGDLRPTDVVPVRMIDGRGNHQAIITKLERNWSEMEGRMDEKDGV